MGITIIHKINWRVKKELFIKREDISIIAEIAQEEGVIEEKDSQFIKNIVKLRNVTLKEIMTPYSVMVTASEDVIIQEFYTQNTELNFSRIPILNDNKIESYILKDTILESIINDKGHFKLAEIKQPIITFPERTRIPKLFDKLLKKREHISLVVDKSDVPIGLVTLEDIIETILGYEIVDETDVVDEYASTRKNKFPKIKNNKMKN